MTPQDELLLAIARTLLYFLSTDCEQMKGVSAMEIMIKQAMRRVENQ